MIIVLFPGHTQGFIVLEQRGKWPVLPACFTRHSDEPPVVRSFGLLQGPAHQSGEK
jgi:hypothetical protein